MAKEKIKDPMAKDNIKEESPVQVDEVPVEEVKKLLAGEEIKLETTPDEVIAEPVQTDYNIPEEVMNEFNKTLDDMDERNREEKADLLFRLDQQTKQNQVMQGELEAGRVSQQAVSTPMSRKEKRQADKVIKAGSSSDVIWKIISGIFGFSTIGLLGAMLALQGTMADLLWIGATFVFFILFLMMFGFIMYLGKKTHAMIEFKAMLTGKPISLFFTDHKRVDWKVIEPEGNILVDEQYGAFLVNEKGAYIDKKTKNVFLAFNPAIGSNASVESFKISDALSKVLRDEKYLGEIREALMHGELDGDDIVFQVNGREERLQRFDKLKENVDFSHLKSLLNTLIPHAINSKIEMTIQQRIGGASKINTAQIILVAVTIIGAAAFAIMMLNMYGGGGGTTVVQAAAPAVQAAVTTAASDPSTAASVTTTVVGG